MRKLINKGSYGDGFIPATIGMTVAVNTFSVIFILKSIT